MHLPTFTLLIVEDLATDRELYRRALNQDSSYTYHLLEAESVAEGLKLCCTESIDAIMLDYALPDGDGLAFLATLDTQSNGIIPPVVMVTEMGDPRIAVRAMKLGAQDYLVKGDLTPGLLQSTVRSAIKNTRLRLQLQQCDDRFFNLSLDLLAIANFEGYFIRLNPAWEKALGFTAAELMAQPYLDLVHPDDLAATLAAAQGLRTGQMVPRFENRYRCKDGSYRWFSWSSRPYDEQNLVYAVAHDITDRKRQEGAILQSQRKFSAIFNQTFQFIGLVSLNGVLLEVNHAALNSIAARESEIVGKNFWDAPWWHTEQLQQQLKDAIATAASGQFVRYEVEFPNPSGGVTITDFSLKPMFDEVGQVESIVAEGHDITARKYAERELKESEERLQTGIEVAGVGLARFDYETNLVALSPEAAVLYGFPADIAFVTREQIHATFHPDERADLEVTIAQVLDPNGMGWFAQDHRVVWPSREVRCLSVRKQVFFDRDRAVPRPSYAILAAIDITLRKQTERKLAESEERLRAGIEVAGVGLARFDYATNLVALSPEAATLYGFAPDELVVTREQIHDTFHPDERADLEVTIAQVLDPNGTGWFAQDHRVVCPSGQVRHLSVRKQVFFDRVGAVPRPSYAILAAIDITLRKQTERALAESEERLRAGIEVAGVGLARFDYATNLVALSPEAASLYGFSADKTFVTREQIHDTFHPDERTALEATITQVINPDGTGWFAQDHRVVWPSGEVRSLSVRKQVFFDRSGAVARPSYAVLAAIDITDLKQTQADLEQRNQELDSFVHVVSHDLKAPLRAIANLSEWIEDDLEGSLSVANQQQMALLRSRVYKMQATIDGLLDYARLGIADVGIVESVSIAELLAEVIDSIAPPPTFTIELPSDLPTLSTRRLLLFQVFANLIGNGIKHHDRLDGSIVISIEDRGDCYEFAVSDDGSGIAPEHHDRIFTIFQAVNPQNRADSTGIGLAIVKKIIEGEGGQIWLDREVKQGARFCFTWLKIIQRNE
jgi:PAS domain S-box-containing protein